VGKLSVLDVLLLGVLLLLALHLCWLYLLVRPPIGRGRSRRRPGYIRPSLSAYVSASPTTGATLTPTATSTGCRTAGLRLAAPEALALRRALSRTTAPTGSGFDTALLPGDHTTGADAA
jgi:hypothetical protein